jgi:hypothetical protein
MLIGPNANGPFFGHHSQPSALSLGSWQTATGWLIKLSGEVAEQKF